MSFIRFLLHRWRQWQKHPRFYRKKTWEEVVVGDRVSYSYSGKRFKGKITELVRSNAGQIMYIAYNGHRPDSDTFRWLKEYRRIEIEEFIER